MQERIRSSTGRGKGPLVRVPTQDIITISQQGEMIYLLAGREQRVVYAAPWAEAEKFFLSGLVSCKEAEAYMWTQIEGKHIDPDFCKIKRIFGLPLLESRAELERLG